MDVYFTLQEYPDNKLVMDDITTLVSLQSNIYIHCVNLGYSNNYYITCNIILIHVFIGILKKL